MLSNHLLCLNATLVYIVAPERRHSSAIKPASTSPFPVSGKNRSSGSGLGPGLGSGAAAGVASGGILGRPTTAGSSLSSSSASSSSNSKLLKPAKDKQPGIQRRPPPAPFRMIQPEKMYGSLGYFCSDCAICQFYNHGQKFTCICKEHAQQSAKTFTPLTAEVIDNHNLVTMWHSHGCHLRRTSHSNTKSRPVAAWITSWLANDSWQQFCSS